MSFHKISILVSTFAFLDKNVFTRRTFSLTVFLQRRIYWEGHPVFLLSCFSCTDAAVCDCTQSNVIEASPDMQRESEKEWYYGNADKERLGPYSFDEVTTTLLLLLNVLVKVKVKVKDVISIAHRRVYTPLMRFSSLTRATGRTATVCSLQTQAGAVAG